MSNATRGDRVIAFIEQFCLVPEGKDVGSSIKLADFQKEFIKEIYDNPHGTRRAILGIARKNGKSALIAGLMLAHICGPEAKLNSQVVSGAMSRDQAALVFNLASKMIQMSPELSKVCRVVPSKKSITGLARNVEYKALAADGTTAHGLSPVLAILDEVGQVKGPSSTFLEAILTSQGAHDEPLQVFISTQSPSDADFFSLIIDDAKKSKDVKTICHVYEAEADCDLLDEKQWIKANPAMGLFRGKDDLKEQLLQASRLPSMEASARNLLLNQRVAQDSLFLAPAIWKKNANTIDMSVFRSNPVALGLDLSARNDLTACVAAAQDDNGIVHLLPWVFCPNKGIEERSQRDRTPYATWVREGKMIALGGASLDYEQIAEHLRDSLDDLGIEPNFVAFDRWRIDVFKKAAEDVGFATWANWHEVGQGFKDMSPRIENFESLLLEERIRHGNHPLLNMAAANAIAVNDPAGSKKLDKSKSTQRIDPLIAAVMAVFAVSEGQLDESFDATSLIG